MAGNILQSSKRMAIVKANARTVAIVGVASFVTVFCLVASDAVFQQNQYQGRVTKAKEAANTQLLKNIAAANDLVNSYKSFVSTPTNVIGGNPNGTGDNDGDNAKIVLDALPSQYDFPALTSSLEKILDSLGIKGNITGTDDQINQENATSSNNPKPVTMAFTLTGSNVGYDSIQQVIDRLQNSIRPMVVDTVDLSGGNQHMSFTIAAHTYYQPGINLNIATKVVQ